MQTQRSDQHAQHVLFALLRVRFEGDDEARAEVGGLRRDQRGLSSVEYVVALVLVVACSLALWKQFGSSITCHLTSAGAAISFLDDRETAFAMQCGVSRDTCDGLNRVTYSPVLEGGRSRAIALGNGAPRVQASDSSASSQASDYTAISGGFARPNVGNHLAGKAPKQVPPGTYVLRGRCINNNGRVEPWTAHYDEYGRQIGRTDFNAGNKAQGIPDKHHHVYDWSSRGAAGREVASHVPGEYQP